ncbi:hypothetical protein HK096_002947 [Nowakowskiella sp. JEL0078]|nr:hypothetical protein HK096_002947 [Nowakowskiella sp. JEL0078]
MKKHISPVTNNAIATPTYDNLVQDPITLVKHVNIIPKTLTIQRFETFFKRSQDSMDEIMNRIYIPKASLSSAAQDLINSVLDVRRDAQSVMLVRSIYIMIHGNVPNLNATKTFSESILGLMEQAISKSWWVNISGIEPWTFTTGGKKSVPQHVRMHFSPHLTVMVLKDKSKLVNNVFDKTSANNDEDIASDEADIINILVSAYEDNCRLAHVGNQVIYGAVRSGTYFTFYKANFNKYCRDALKMPNADVLKIIVPEKYRMRGYMTPGFIIDSSYHMKETLSCFFAILSGVDGNFEWEDNNSADDNE